MRPRRVVLCVAESALTLSVQMFLVDTWGYRPLAASTASDALGILKRAGPGAIDLLILTLPLPARDSFLEAARQLLPEMRTIALNDTREYDGNCKVDAFLPSHSSPADLLERIRALAARKRGPKKAGPEERDGGVL
jgi:two-component system response regulator CpxR